MPTILLFAIVPIPLPLPPSQYFSTISCPPLLPLHISSHSYPFTPSLPLSLPPFLPLPPFTLPPSFSLPPTLYPLTPSPSRNIGNELNVFRGLVKNPIFVGIIIFTAVAQYGLVEFGGAFVRTVRYALLVLLSLSPSNITA